MHKENILMTVELRELWSPSRTALMALKCSSGRRVKAMRMPWPGPVLKLTFQGTHSPHRRSQVQGCTGRKETPRHLSWQAVGRGSEWEGTFQLSPAFPKLGWLCCFLIFGKGSRGVGEKGLWSNVFGNTSYTLCLTPILYIKGSENSCN